MDRGAWQATVLGGYKELVMTEHAHTESRPTKMRFICQPPISLAAYHKP